MQSVIDLANQLNVPLNPPATEDDIARLETLLNWKLPAQLREFYLTTNGLSLHEDNDFPAMMSVQQIMRLSGGMPFGDMGLSSGDLLPLTENHDSAYVCLCCDDLMAGYILYLSHEIWDEEPPIKFRDFAAFIDGLADHYRRGYEGFQQMRSQFLQPERTSHDIETARKLIARYEADGANYQEEEMLHHALWLLADPAEMIALTRYLGIGRVRERLEALHPDIAQTHVETLIQQFEQFTGHCIELLKQAGISVDQLQHEPGDIQVHLAADNIWLRMSTFYQMRQSYATQAAFDTFFVERISGRKTPK